MKINTFFANPLIRVAFFVPIILALAGSLAFLFLGPRDGDDLWVRVLIAEGRDELELSSSSRCGVYDSASGAALAKGFSLARGTRVVPAVNGMVVGDLLVPAERIKVSPSAAGSIRVNGVDYRGEIHIVKRGARFDAVNRVRIEDYLKGVLPKEVNRFWPFEALKAQAVASRSFAAYEALRRRSKDHDLSADTFSQVYGGKTSERWRTNWAVDATRGKVLVYNDRVFPAYFHSCCGGHTEDAAILWGKSSGPLKGVRCPWCRFSPYFRWRAKVPRDEMTAMLKSAARGIDSVDDIRPGKRDRSGRIEYLDIRSSGRWVRMGCEDLRAIAGGSRLKSANFKIKKYPDLFLFAGHGWGHGVGMCQWGAFTLSLGWWRAEKILKYYYPGTRLGDLKGTLRGAE